MKNTTSREKIKNQSSVSIFFVSAFIVLAISVLNTTGKWIWNVGENTISKLDIEQCKGWIEVTYPAIKVVFNSGKSRFDLSSDIIDNMEKFSGLYFTNPLSIIQNVSGYSIFLNKHRMNSLYTERDNIDSNIDIPIRLIGERSSSITSSGEEPEANPNIGFNYKDIEIRSEFQIKLDIKNLAEEPFKMPIAKKGPKVLIYHTHTTESYIKEMDDYYNKNILVRTTNNSLNVVGVGNEIANKLKKKYGIEVIHNGTNHVAKGDTGAYARSLNTVEGIIASYPSIGIILDVHRDGIGGGQKLRIIKKNKSITYAKIMLVVGSNATGLAHEKWEENLKFAIKLQRELEEIVPGITRPICLSKNRYNQHVKNTAVIVEIGGDGNLIEESLATAGVLSKAISQIIN